MEANYYVSMSARLDGDHEVHPVGLPSCAELPLILALRHLLYAAHQRAVRIRGDQFWQLRHPVLHPPLRPASLCNAQAPLRVNLPSRARSTSARRHPKGEARMSPAAMMAAHSSSTCWSRGGSRAPIIFWPSSVRRTTALSARAGGRFHLQPDASGCRSLPISTTTTWYPGFNFDFPLVVVVVPLWFFWWLKG